MAIWRDKDVTGQSGKTKMLLDRDGSRNRKVLSKLPALCTVQNCPTSGKALLASQPLEILAIDFTLL